MIKFLKILRSLYVAARDVNKAHENGDVQLYNCVENDTHVYIVISKEVCIKYNLQPELKFLKVEDQ